jgi:MFS family permease
METTSAKRPSSAHEHVPSPEPMPPGIHNVYIYDVFNTTSWSVVLGSPMLLFLQRLDATATILAIAASLSPILNILQIPAARYVERIGYRRFVLAGWVSRSFMIIGMTVVAFLPDSVDRTTRIVLMLFFLLIYNVLRGISLCGLLPWFTHIVPESRRGEFLARDQSGIAFSSIVSLLIFGLLLYGGHAWYSFGMVFAISALAAFASLLFLRRVPDVPVEQIVANDTPLPWREMLFYPPFFKYIRYNIIINMALGASNVFWVRYFRTFLHVNDSHVLLIACATNIVLAMALLMITPVIDRTGNKQVLTLSGLMLLCHFGGWALISGGLIPFNRATLTLQIITAGFGGSLWNLSNVRAVMGLVPVMGRAHFLALYSVASNLTLGLIPLLWGPLLDYLENWHVVWGFWHWNNYSLLYSTMAFTILVGLGALRALPEPESMTWDVFMSELLVKTPSRAVSRLIGRLRGPGIG